MRLRSLFLVLLGTGAGVGCAPPSDEREPLGTGADEIVGGIADPLHPYVVGVGDTSGAFCSGTVISARSVITAGHCYGGITRVFVGPSSNNPSQVLTVTQEVRFPNFNSNSLHNDITMLRLSADAPMQPAPLLRETMANNVTYIGPDYTFVGYGVSNGQTQTGFGTKRVVTFPIDKVGPASVGGTPGSIDSTQFYYQLSGKNTCNGDSGGPAFIIRNGVERHAGVTSYGDGPCLYDGVQQRTDTPNITAFIQGQIDAFEGSNACRSNGVCDETCNVNGQVRDPDCAENHCAADGVCAEACALPIDPDCNEVHCNHDGMCDPSCANFDLDCAPLCAADGLCMPGCSPADPDCGGGGAVCGNGVVELGEQCDDGNAVDTDACLSTCKTAKCGDGYLHAGVEQCDDGNASNGDACTASCAAATCGDGYVHAGVEQCDDGNLSNGDACLTSCVTAACGDGYVRNGVEECDDGNLASGDGCSASCALEGTGPFCGNGVLEAGEACDDGNVIGGDGCSAVCTVEGAVPVCGNGAVEGAEQCDDGNVADGDGCSAACALEGQAVCGDGLLDPSEQCDDGNVENYDGCSAHCLREETFEVTVGCSLGGAGGGFGGALALAGLALFGARRRRTR